MTKDIDVQAALRALFAKHENLRLSLQGMKTQRGYMRDHLSLHGTRLTRHKALILPMRRRIAAIAFRVRLLMLSVFSFYATIIIGYLWTRF